MRDVARGEGSDRLHQRAVHLYRNTALKQINRDDQEAHIQSVESMLSSWQEAAGSGKLAS